MTLLLCGLSALFVVQLAKVIFHPHLQNRSLYAALIKMLVAVGVAAGTAALYSAPPAKQLIVYSLAGASLATVLHKVIRFASIGGDWLSMEVMRNRPRPR